MNKLVHTDDDSNSLIEDEFAPKTVMILVVISDKKIIVIVACFNGLKTVDLLPIYMPPTNL